MSHLLALFLALQAPAAIAVPTGVAASWSAGETLDYDVQWLRISGGTARMTIASSGDSQLRITSVARSGSLFSRFFKVRDEIESVVSRDGFTTVSYRKRLDERGRKKDELTTIDEGVATRTAGGKTKRTKVPPMVFDPISLIYHLRTLDLEPGQSHEFPVIADGKLYGVKAVVRGRETLTTEAGTFHCVIVEPVMHAINNDAKDSRLQIWISEDDRRLPVRIRSEVNVGTITATLRALKAGVTSTEPPVVKGQ